MLVLFLIAFVDLVGFGIVIPLLPFYGERFGASPEVITLLMATFSLCQFIGAPLWGRLSDRLGRRPVLVVSLAFSVLSYLMLGFAHALWMLFAARALAGLTAGNIAAAQAYIADVTTPDNRAKGMGLIGAAFGLGFIAGPAIGGLMAGASADRANLLAPALLAAGLSGTALLGTLLLLKESLTPEMRARLSTVRRMGRVEAARRFLARVTLGRLILLGFLMVASFAAMESTFALWAQHVFGYGPSHTGMLFAYVGVIAALVQGGLIGRLSRRFGEARLLAGGTAAIAAGLLLLPFAHALPLLIGAMTLLAGGFGVSNPSLSSLISKQAGEDERGAVLGLFQGTSSLSRVFGPALAGVLFTGLGANAPFLAAALVMAVVVLLAMRTAEDSAVAPGKPASAE